MSYLLLHHGGERPLHPFELLVQQVPDARLDGVRVSQDVDGHRPPLAIARQATDALMEPHRVPRHVHVHQHGAALLQVDTLAAGLRRHQETHAAGIECLGRLFAGLADCPDAARRPFHAVEPVVAVDESGLSKAELPM